MNTLTSKQKFLLQFSLLVTCPQVSLWRTDRRYRWDCYEPKKQRRTCELDL